MKSVTLVATLVGALAVSAAPTSKRQSGPSGIIDDGNSAVTYPTGDWTHLTNQGQSDYNGTLSYACGDSAYEFTIDDPAGTPQGFSINTSLKSDRGKFNVFRISPDGHKIQIGTGDQYSATADGQEASSAVFTYTFPSATNLDFRVENIPDDSRIPGGAYLSLDSINWYTGP